MWIPFLVQAFIPKPRALDTARNGLVWPMAPALFRCNGTRACPTLLDDLIKTSARNVVANLAHQVEIGPCWLGIFVSQPCRVAGRHCRANTFLNFLRDDRSGIHFSVAEFVNAPAHEHSAFTRQRLTAKF
jgi:hypothetical protein